MEKCYHFVICVGRWASLVFLGKYIAENYSLNPFYMIFFLGLAMDVTGMIIIGLGHRMRMKKYIDELNVSRKKTRLYNK